MRSLAELLEVAVRLAPERFKRVETTDADPFLVIHSNNWHGWRVNPEQAWDRPHILAAVMEAIEGRGWTWAVGMQPGASRGSAYVAAIEGADDLYEGTESSPAHALLAAFVAALEAEAKQ